VTGGREPRGSDTVDDSDGFDDREHCLWNSLVRVLLSLPAALDRQLQHDAGLTLFDYVVLVRLGDAPDRTLTMTRLAAAASGSLSRLSHAVSGLERDGLVTRRRAARDRRATVAILTDRGARRLAAATPGHVTAVRESIVTVLAPHEQQMLAGLAGRIADRLLGPAAAHAGEIDPDVTSEERRRS
jgi:DNA-binding MarR family transcriptional regulator